MAYRGELSLVPGAAQRAQPFGLVALDGRVDTQRLVVLFLGDDEAVDPDDNPLLRVDSRAIWIRGPLDLGLLETLLDRGDGAAEVLRSSR